jgi:hypothetical protein
MIHKGKGNDNDEKDASKFGDISKDNEAEPTIKG